MQYSMMSPYYYLTKVFLIMLNSFIDILYCHASAIANISVRLSAPVLVGLRHFTLSNSALVCPCLHVITLLCKGRLHFTNCAPRRCPTIFLVLPMYFLMVNKLILILILILSSETISFIYDKNTSPPNERIPAPICKY